MSSSSKGVISTIKRRFNIVEHYTLAEALALKNVLLNDEIKVTDKHSNLFVFKQGLVADNARTFNHNTLPFQLTQVNDVGVYATPMMVNGTNAKDERFSMSNINVLGDSISQGYNAANMDQYSWTGIMRRILNNHFSTDNLGFMGLSSGNLDYHTIVKTSGVWVDSASNEHLGFIKYESSSVDGILTATLLKKQDTFSLCYDQLVGGGVVDIYTNGVKRHTLNTSGVAAKNMKSDTISLTGYQFPVSIELRKVDANPVIFAGFWYSNEAQVQTALMFNNYARSGMKLVDVDDGIIDINADANTLFLTMGHNDALGLSDQATFTAKINRLITKANANNCYVVVVDFLWSKDESNFYRTELKRLASAVNNGLYIAPNQELYGNNIPKMISEGFFYSGADTSHPSNKGHNLIATGVANILGLSATAAYKKDSETYSNTVLDEWHRVGEVNEPVFENSWVNTFSDSHLMTKFRKEGRSVQIELFVTGGVGNTVLFTLPASYRPNFNHEHFLYVDGLGSATVFRRVSVSTTGTVTIIEEGGFTNINGVFSFPIG